MLGDRERLGAGDLWQWRAGILGHAFGDAHAGHAGYSVRRATAGRVRAAAWAGKYAMRLTRRRTVGDGEEEGEGRDRGGGGDADAVGDGLPDEGAEGESGGDADDEADGCEGGGLPGDGGAYLSAVEAEGFEQGEVAAASAYGGDERVADGEERESGEEGGEGGGEPVDLAEAVDFGGDVGRVGLARLGLVAMRCSIAVRLTPGANRTRR